MPAQLVGGRVEDHHFPHAGLIYRVVPTDDGVRVQVADQLASAALTVIDRDGLSGFTMRAVAQQLRMSTMAVYRYVQNRHELEELVLEHVPAGDLG